MVSDLNKGDSRGVKWSTSRFWKSDVGCDKKEKGSRIASISFGHVRFEMPIGHPNRDGKLV